MLAVAAGAMTISVLWAGPTQAETVSVASEAEYRAALTTLSADATGPHTVEITADFTITGGTDPSYTGDQNLTIVGNGHTISGGDARRILFVSDSVVLEIRDLTLRDGFTTEDGGALGSATGPGGSARFVFVDTAFVDNHADGDGGAVSSPLSLNDITHSTFTGNSAGGSGGALAMGTGGVGGVLGHDLTFTGNTAAVGGGAIRGGSYLAYSTLADNRAPAGANVSIPGTIPTPQLVTHGTVIANPLGGGENCALDEFGSQTQYSYSTDTSCEMTGTGDTEGAADPQLEPLGDNGGPTPTRLPARTGPLVDAIPDTDCPLPEELEFLLPPSTPLDDQRHVLRPQDGDGDGTAACDIGAVELEPPAEPAPPPAGPDGGPVAADPAFTG